MPRRWLGSVLLLLSGALPGCADASTPFEARVFRDAAGRALPYRLLRPRPYDPRRRYPLVLFLHGAGERGTDNRGQLLLGVGVFARPATRSRFPCFVVVPQCPAGQQWVETPWTAAAHVQPEQPAGPLLLALALVEAVQAEFSIDAGRLYVTGLSMGGFGTWDAITRWPGRFAAAVPVCGGADETRAPLAARVPIWAFHGSDDDTVQPLRSRNMVAALRRAGGSPRYTEYAGVGHDSWVRAYSEPELLPWLFAQRRSAR